MMINQIIAWIFLILNLIIFGHDLAKWGKNKPNRKYGYTDIISFVLNGTFSLLIIYGV